MSIHQIESSIKSLQSEIERLSKNATDEAKNESRLLSAISRTQKSINKHTSASSLKSKQKSIQNDSEKIDKSKTKQAEIRDKIGKKQVELSKKKEELQKEREKAYSAMQKKQDDELEARQKLLETTTGVNVIDERYDFFISHAWEDKEEVAKPLADALIDRGAKVWLDKYQMKVGDSLRKSIDDGLVNSRYGIIILSEIYFKKFWTGQELNGLFAKQEDGEKVILPVWHNVSKDKVKLYSPILADMVALKTADYTIDELADEFYQLIQ